MSRPDQPPDLKNYMDMKLQIKLNANCMVVGTLRGFDQFMNLVADNTLEVNGNEKIVLCVLGSWIVTPVVEDDGVMLMMIIDVIFGGVMLMMMMVI
ncbi:hypothetical protein Dsin_024370 [Dipteronia sinensis]|uniref:Sm protein G n=1 Tax=Dipteronia sinensis TaxID=43782 RepID=A0AAD9ZTW3_9ROSI|nr:hypothetical protein Dsin_024370 [Dipteronia sinensis]